MDLKMLQNKYALMIFCILIVTYIYVLPKDNWNTLSRSNLTQAIVDEGVFYIDSYHENTGDKAYFDGHYYTDKSIGPSMLAAPAYFLFKQLSNLLLPVSEALSSFVSTIGWFMMTWFSTSIPSALSAAMLFLFIVRFTQNPWHAVTITLAYGLGTIVFPYSTMMFQHQLATSGLFITFYLLWKLINDRVNINWLWLAGIVVGIVVISDYLSALLVSLIVLWALYKTRDWRFIVYLSIGALPSILLFMIYNTLCFGSPISIGSSYLTQWQAVQGQGFFGLVSPTAEALWGISFSSFRGLFFISPFLLFGFHGIYVMLREGIDRSLVVLFCTIIALVFLYNSSAVMWWAGRTIGPRYLVAAIPFLTVPIIFSMKTIFAHKPIGILFVIFLCFSFANVWIQTLADGLAPDIETQNIKPENTTEGEWVLQQFDEGNVVYNPLTEYSIPKLLEGEITPTVASKVFDKNNALVFIIPLCLSWVTVLFIFRIFQYRI